MTAQRLWSIFAETGDPMLYLLYARAQQVQNGKDTLPDHTIGA